MGRHGGYRRGHCGGRAALYDFVAVGCKMTEWSGEERRTVRVEIVNMVSAMIEPRLQHLEDKIDRNAEAAERRHSALIDSITAYMGHVELVEQAFLKDQQGRPDFVGHHADHHQRKTFGDWLRKQKDDALGQVMRGAMYSVFIFILYTLWDAFLKGPPK